MLIILTNVITFTVIITLHAKEAGLTIYNQVTVSVMIMTIGDKSYYRENVCTTKTLASFNCSSVHFSNTAL